jgi:hypothetical protein
LKQTGARSAGYSAVCNDFILFACILIIPWGDLECYNLDIDGKMMAMGHVARIWEEDDSMLSTD